MLILKSETELESILEDQICLSIPKEIQDDQWELLQGYSYPAAKWTAYLNRLSYEFIVAYFKQEYDCEIALAPIPKKPDSVWEFVTGFALNIDGKRVIVIPDETDSDEFSIPYEWVDIPQWAGEYYLAVQIRPDSGWLRVFGFATHQQIKQKAEYDRIMRTYTLSQDQIIDDIEVLLTSLAIAANQKVEVPALTAISQAQENKYLATLKQPKLYSPRLDLSDEHWATFVSDNDLREKLWRMRMQSPLQDVIQQVQQGVNFITNWFDKLKIHGADYTDLIFQPFDDVIECFSQPQFTPKLASGFRGGDTLTRPQESVSMPSKITVPDLIAFIKSEQRITARVHSLQLLGDIAHHNQDAIAFLSDLRSNPNENWQVRREAAVSLGRIDNRHPQAGLRRIQAIAFHYQTKTIRLSLEITIMPMPQDKVYVHFYLTNPDQPVLPNGLRLEAIDRNGNTIFVVQKDDSDIYQKGFTADHGDYFLLKISLDNVNIQSEFEI
jgi:hypothetical protein